MRKKLLALAIGMLGVAAGFLFTVAYPPFYTNQATVLVEPGGEWDPASLAIMVTSAPVLTAAAHQLHLNQTVLELRGDLQVEYVSRAFTVTAKGQDPTAAKALASAVAGSFRAFLPTDDHVLKKGKPTRKPIRVTVLRFSGPGTAQRPLASYALTSGLGLLAGLLLALVALRPSRRQRRRAYRAAFRVIFGRGRIAGDFLNLIDGPASEDEKKAQRHADRDNYLAAWHPGRSERLGGLAAHIDVGS